MSRFFQPTIELNRDGVENSSQKEELMWKIIGYNAPYLKILYFSIYAFYARPVGT